MDLYEYRNEIPLNTLKSWREKVLATANFQPIGWTGLAKEPYRHWAAYPEFNDVYKEIFDCLNESFVQDGFKLKPERVIVNMYNHGDSSWLHRDREGAEAWTLLLFMNEYWDINWGGDFVLVKDNEIYKSVAPTPGKFILFQANILHAARPVSREAEFARMGLAIQCTNHLKI
jgi:hypothetical protein